MVLGVELDDAGYRYLLFPTGFFDSAKQFGLPDSSRHLLSFLGYLGVVDLDPQLVKGFELELVRVVGEKVAEPVDDVGDVFTESPQQLDEVVLVVVQEYVSELCQDVLHDGLVPEGRMLEGVASLSHCHVGDKLLAQHGFGHQREDALVLDLHVLVVANNITGLRLYFQFPQHKVAADVVFKELGFHSLGQLTLEQCLDVLEH